MARRKKEIVLPHLNDAGKDLSKLWYVEYSLRNPVSGKMERYRNYEGFTNIDTIEKRVVFAKKMIKDLTKKIKSGEINCVEQIKDESPAGIPIELRTKLQQRIIFEDPQLWLAICFIYYSAIRLGNELRLMKRIPFYSFICFFYQSACH